MYQSGALGLRIPIFLVGELAIRLAPSILGMGVNFEVHILGSKF